MYGYSGKLLEVNLSRGTVAEIPLGDPELLRRFLGGSGLAARLYFDRTLAQGKKPEPLDADSPLFVFPGPLNCSRLPGTSRFSVATRSPLTGLWGDSSCGGNFGPTLKYTGYDGIVFTGASPEPVYLYVDEATAELRDAWFLWGKDTYQTEDGLIARHGKGTRVLSIGPAGENLVRYASLVNDRGAVAGRAGMGAVPGSKRLKAIAVKGSKRVELADPKAAEAIARSVRAKARESVSMQTLTSLGTDGGMYLGGAMLGDVPTGNWRTTLWEEGYQKLDGAAMAETILVKNAACLYCPVGCKRVVKVDQGPYRMPPGSGPEYETAAALGAMCLVDDLEAVAYAGRLCDLYGMDTISCGATISFAMEATERGLLKSDLSWGDAAAVIGMIEKIARREGLGDLLAEGSKRAAAKIGGADLAVEIKGLEAPMHDPRAFHGLALSYATGTRGACHMACETYALESGTVFRSELGLAGPFENQTGQGKASLVVKAQDWGALLNSLTICQFINWNYTATELVEATNAVTGFGYTLGEFMETGARIWHLKRGIGCLLGVTAADDRVPSRALAPLEEGPTAGSAPDFELMVREYYPLRGLDAQGRPSRERLAQLGLADLANLLHGQ